VRTARKHIGWYVRPLPGGEAFRARMNLLENCEAQWQAVGDYFDELGQQTDRMPDPARAAAVEGAELDKKEGETA
jgi:tRNA-dihydrouridine synthase B